MDHQKLITSALHAIGIMSLEEKEHELECQVKSKELEKANYDWELDDLSLSLIHGYYHCDGRHAEQVLQTPFKNFAIAKISTDYELFEIGKFYRPVVVSFKDHPEIKHWFEEASGRILQ